MFKALEFSVPCRSGMVAHIFNTGTKEVEVGYQKFQVFWDV